MSKMLDTPAAAEAAEKADDIASLGYTAVGCYFFRSSGFKSLLTADVAAKLSAAGLYVVSVWESGFPTTGSYFSTAQGNEDAHVAAVRASDAGQPAGGVIYAAADYDAPAADMGGIVDYFREFRRVLAAVDPSYTTGVYGSGFVCGHLSELGLVSHTWLSGSEGWDNFDLWKPRADIVQGATVTLLGMDVDLDTTNGDAGGWKV